ncbi:response regulator transcription factor [Melittangium boletus]|uniref:Response regulator n=1 Tax=Melittangium boletus DSM 14713 TaxID=1294270 RepID=A0A250IBK7_9BACT|nr:response regulator [Melittangium boletus]ATB29219.1 response regulator [Melittangium boletus DSM 14713]
MPAHALPILLVESHLEVLASILDALEFEGYRVMAARSEGEAWKRLEGMGRPGLVLLDGALEEAGRARLLRRFQEEGVPVVLLAANDEPLEPGPRAVLRKPFHLDTLYATVAAHGPPRGAPRFTRGNRDAGFFPGECGSFVLSSL